LTGRKQRRADIDGRCLAELSADREHLQLRLDVEAIARLDLDGRDAFGRERLDARERRCVQRVGRRCARRAHGRHDAATGARDVLVARATQALLEFFGAIAGEHEVRVAVDKRRRDPATTKRARVVHIDVGHISAWPQPPDRAALDDDNAVVDDAVVGSGHRGHVEVGQREIHCIAR
jgi:hypothetical protein